MKKFTKSLALVLSLSLVLTLFVGCNDEPANIEDYATTVAAYFGDEEIMLDEANFYLRYGQASVESYMWSYYQMYGYENYWVVPDMNEDGAETGKTMGDKYKEGVMQSIHQTRTLCYCAGNYNLSTENVDVDACDAKAAEMIEGLDPAVAAVAPITAERLSASLQKNYLANLVAKAILDGADTTYTDDEVNVYKITYVAFSSSDEAYIYDETEATNETAEETEEEVVEETEETEETEEENKTLDTRTAEQRAAAFLVAAQAAGDLCTAADADKNLTELTGSYLMAGDDEAEEAEDLLYENTKDIAVGTIVSFYDEEEDKYYVVERTADNDADLTEAKKESVIEDKKAEHFADVIDDLYGDAPSFKVTAAWDNLVLTTGEKLVPETEEEENETLYVDDEETETSGDGDAE